jgi:hypothetical protein
LQVETVEVVGHPFHAPTDALMMKQCAFSRASVGHDVIDASALKSVFVKFVKSSLEDFSSRVFWGSGGDRFHLMF